MSAALAIAFRNRAIGLENLANYPKAAAAQIALAGLLAKDADGTTPRVRRANKGSSVLYPEVTFRDSAGAIDGRFANGTAMGDPILDVEIWAQSRDDTPDSIEKQLLILFDQRFDLAPPLPLSEGLCVWMELFVEPMVLYNDKINAWCRLLRFHAKEARFY